jgi:hypothetical protein
VRPRACLPTRNWVVAVMLAVRSKACFAGGEAALPPKKSIERAL